MIPAEDVADAYRATPFPSKRRLNLTLGLRASTTNLLLPSDHRPVSPVPALEHSLNESFQFPWFVPTIELCL